MRFFAASGWILRIVLAAVFVLAAVQKLRRPVVVDAQAMSIYDRWFPPASPRDRAFIASELFVAAWLVSGVLKRSSAAVALLLLAIYTAVLALELRQNQPLPCGCMMVTPGLDPAAVRRQLIGGIARNLVLIAACAWLIVFVQIRHRPRPQITAPA